MTDLEVIQDLLKDKESICKYKYYSSTNLFHLEYFRDEYYSINDFYFGFLEFKHFLRNLLIK